MRILFVSSNRIGDAVITTGLLDHLIHRYPDCRITVACGSVAEGVFLRMPRLERLILFDKLPWRRHWLRLWRMVVGTRWDLVVDVRGSLTGFLVWTRQRAIMRKLPGRKYEQFARLLRLSPAPLPVVWTAEADRAKAAALLGDRLVIGFGPTANSAKMWPAESFAALFRALAQGPLAGAVPAVFAGPGAQERALAAPLLAALPEAIDLVGRLSLPEVAACMQRCAIYIGNDSGLMHLAAAAGVPTVGLCATTMDRAEEMAPAGRFARWALGSGARMEDLSVAQAFEASVDILAKARG
jgi:ADP-heptose:LPS heptosyltransferase